MLTKRQIDALKWRPRGPRMQVVFDQKGASAMAGAVPGFGVRVLPSGRKSFVLWYRTAGGRQRMVTIGRYGTLTLEQGRDRAKKILNDVAAGHDPLEAKRETRTAHTVESFAAVYIDHAKRPKSRGGKKTWRDDDRRLNTYVLPAIGHRRLAEVNRADIRRLHNQIGERTPYEANRVLALVSTVFTHAIDTGHLPETAPNPTRRVKPFPETARDRYVTPTEMPAILAAIDAEPNPYIRAAFRMYLLTGLRRSELLGLRWADVDLNARTLRLPTTKAGRPHTLPLSAPAVAILHDLPRGLRNPYVFCGHVRGRPLVNVAKPWRRIRARAWLTLHPEQAATLRKKAAAAVKAAKHRGPRGSDRDAVVDARLLTLAWAKAQTDDVLRLHDLRRTVGSWLAMGGASLPLIGKVLNHTNASTTQIYARLAEDAPRAALEELAVRIAAAEGVGA
jgi:integrase